MKKSSLSAVLNFFFIGGGYLYNGKRMLLGSLLTIAAIGLTYVENFYVFADGNNLQAQEPNAFYIMFASVLIMNTGLAIDAYREANDINSNQK
jgi:hypothetical protein